MFEKLLPFLMYAILLATFVFAAVGLIFGLNLVLAFFGIASIEITPITVGVLALLMGIAAFFMK